MIKVVFLGATKFSEEMLNALLDGGIQVQAVFSIPQNFEIKKRGAEKSEKYQNSNYSDIQSIAINNEIPCYIVSGGEESLSKYEQVISDIQPDLILVLGWYYIVPRKIRNLAKIGTFGIHASMLPSYAGGSPLVWALINGERKTGITMFKIEDGVDDGDILAQTELEISKQDTIKTLYDKVTVLAKKMLVTEIKNLDSGTANFIQQDKSKIKPLPIRTPADGLIDWHKSNEEIYNFVRAQTKPYPCAFSFLNGEKIKFVSVTEIKAEHHLDLPVGTVLKNGEDYLIKTGQGFLLPQEIEVNEQVVNFKELFAAKPIEKNIFENQ